MIKSFKIRIYPTKAQEELVWKHIGSCRYIWNWMLAKQKELYDAGEKHLSGFDMIRLITSLKNDGEHEWLSDVSTSSLQIVCQDLHKAYNCFFKKVSSLPKFKSKKCSKLSYPVCSNRFYFVDNRTVQIQKLGKVRYKTDFSLPLGKEHKFSNPRITNRNGKWILSFGMECENQTPKLTDMSMGIDLGIKDLAIAECNGQIVFHNINKSKKMKELYKKQKHLQRSISRKYEANKQGNQYIKTKNIERLENKLRKLYCHIANIRKNYIHQCTHVLVSLFPSRVVMEDLNIQGMMKNRRLARAVQEQCLFEFIRQMKYKCEWNGIEFVQANRFYPSSKTCSCCGNVKRDLKLSDRTYKCDICGLKIDRDYNAAINLSKYAI